MLRRSLTTVTLVFVMYFNTSGGPYSLEGLVAQVGPGLAIAMLVVLPLVFSLPEVLIIGELASMLPEEGGYYRWVRRAFGPFWGFQNGWWTWMYSLVDMAIYPVLFTQYLQHFVGPLGAPARAMVALGVIWTATAINLRGALPVGRASVVSGVFIVAVFAIGAVFAMPHVTHVPWNPMVAPGQTTLGSIGVGASIALWNYVGWDNASTVQGEVQDPSRAYPRALSFALPLVTIGYLLPMLASLGATDWHTWREGNWPQIIAAAVGGRAGQAIGALVAAGGIVSALALFNALLLAYSRIPLAMATDSLLPAPLARVDANGTPRNAVLTSAVAYSFFALAPFGDLVVADVLLYAMALFLEFGALVRLRGSEPELRGAFRIPLGRLGVAVLAAIPVMVLVSIVALEVHDGEYGLPAVLGSVIAAALGVPAYALARRRAITTRSDR